MDLLGRKAQKRLSELESLLRLLSSHADLGWGNYHAAVSLLKEKNQELEDLRNPPQAPFSPVPLHYSEAQEDILWAKGLELIDTEEASKLLRELDFENTQLYLDESSLV